MEPEGCHTRRGRGKAARPTRQRGPRVKRGPRSGLPRLDGPRQVEAELARVRRRLSFGWHRERWPFPGSIIVRRAVIVIGTLSACLLVAVVVVSRGHAQVDPDLVPPTLTEWFATAVPADVTLMTHRMRVAVVSTESRADKPANLAGIREVVAAIKERQPDTRLVVFGESSLGRYFEASAPADYQSRIAEPVPGPATDALAAVARQSAVHLAVGLVERDGSRLFNALVVFGPNGAILGTHRKMMLHDFDERNGITKAEPNAQVVDVNGFKLGLAICADANSRWLVAAYRARRIDALVYSVTSKVPPTVCWFNYWPMSRRFDAWVLAANRSGREGEDVYPGTAFIAGPNGALHAIQGSGSGFVTAVIGRR